MVYFNTQYQKPGKVSEKNRGGKMTDIITLGELLIDLTQSGTDENGNGIFTAFPGGAPANVAVAASRLGASTGFIGKAVCVLRCSYNDGYRLSRCYR